MVSSSAAALSLRHSAQLGRPATALALQIVGGEYDGRTIELHSTKISIGAASHSTLRLAGGGFAPLELFVIRGERGTVVQNSSPRNLLNGRAFSDALLQAGDRLSVGPLVFVVKSCQPPRSKDTNPACEARAEVQQPHLEAGVVDQNQVEALDAAFRQIASLEQQLQKFRAESAADILNWQAEREQWIDELTRSRQQTIELQSEYDRTKAELQRAEEELRTHNADLTIQLDHAQARVAVLETGTAQREEQWRESQKAIEEQRDGLAAELEQLREQLRAAKQEMEHVLSQQQALADGGQAAYETAKGQLSEREVQIADLLAQGQDAAGQIEQLRSEIVHAQEKIAELQAVEADREALRQTSESLEAKLAEALAERDVFCAEAASAQDSLEQARTRAADLESEIADLQRLLEERPPAASEVGEEQQSLAERLAELEERERQYVARRDELELAAARLQSLQRAFEEQQRAVPAPSPQPADSDPAHSFKVQNERALAELLQVRQQLDRRSEELAQLEQHLAAREAELQMRQLAAPAAASAEQSAELASEASEPDEPLDTGTNVLDDQEIAAQTIAERFLAGEIGAEGIDGTEYTELPPDEANEEYVDEIILADAESPAEERATLAAPRPQEQFFTAPKSGAPVSAAEILAKYTGGHTFDDSDDAAEEPLRDEAPSAEARHVGEETQETAADDDDSIQQYMEQLMRRVRGDTAEMPKATPAPAEPVIAKVSEKPASAPATAKRADSVAAEMLRSHEYTPRSSAPERSDNLAKMRELANTSARSAIDQASKQRRAQTAAIHLLLAAGAATAGVVLINYGSVALAVPRYITATVAFGITAWWGYRAVSYLLGIKPLPERGVWKILNKKAQPQKRREAAESAAAVSESDAENLV